MMIHAMIDQVHSRVLLDSLNKCQNGIFILSVSSRLEFKQGGRL